MWCGASETRGGAETPRPLTPDDLELKPSKEGQADVDQAPPCLLSGAIKAVSALDPVSGSFRVSGRLTLRWDPSSQTRADMLHKFGAVEPVILLPAATTNEGDSIDLDTLLSRLLGILRLRWHGLADGDVCFTEALLWGLPRDAAKDRSWNIDCEFTQTLRHLFELQNFPFDTQRLKLKLEFLHQLGRSFEIEEAGLNAGVPIDKCSSFVVAADAQLPSGWQVDLLAQPILFKRKRFAHILDIEILVARQSTHYVTSYMLPIGVLVSLVLTSYFVSWEDFGARAGVVLTLLLTVVAYQLVVRQDLPPTPYSTVLDGFCHKAN